ncbi:MAG: gamma-glutamylcyclotransferase [Alphaproteobacteria bacterium]
MAGAVDSLRETPDAVAGTAEILARWQPDEPYWVFAYGSLMWNPGFPFEEQRDGRLHGYHRAFCIYSHHYRGTAENPGLVLGLDRGGSCRGTCFRVHPDDVRQVTEMLWRREMITRVYKPLRTRVQTGSGPLAVQTFIADPAHEQYAGKLSLEAMATMIRAGRGIAGENAEYLANTVGHLLDLGIDDGPLHRLMDLCRSSEEA